MYIMKKCYSLILLGIVFTGLLLSCQHGGKSAGKLIPLTQYVDPYIGTGDHGHVFMGANVPFGLVQLGPTNITQGWDWCSGYHYSDSTIYGFGHMHLSGTGIGDLGDISFMPITGNVSIGRGHIEDSESGMYSLFSHDSEKTKPGYYAVHLDRYKIDVELTATKRVGFHKYTYPDETAKLIIDLENGIGWDAFVDATITQENDTLISGFRRSSGWANDQRVYFSAVFSKPIQSFQTHEIERKQEDNIVKKVAYGELIFDNSDKEPLYVKVALSPVSTTNAALNMQTELPGWDFTQTIADADYAWNKELNKVIIEALNEQDRKVFYTALYHSMIAPSEFCDVNRDYWGTDKQVHSQASFVNYTTLSLWDTYRAAHPLMTIIHPEKMSDIINTMLTIYKEQGKLPVWHLMANETNCMVGNPGIPVVADAWLKGIEGFDKELAYEAMKASALLDERGLLWMREIGYVPFDKENESVAKTMEYALADWCIAQVAQQLGKTDDYELFLKRSKAYEHLYDPTIRFMRGVSADGNFRPTPLNPFESVHRENDYTEGNAWQYTWLVPHDAEGLVNLFGSKEAFIEKLDSLFIVEGDLGKEASPDISGLIGQYAHGNEPSHHIIYMYPYVGQQWKTAEKARYVLTNLYHDQPAGLSGNEDVGQMSAWYILSSLGFYQVEPAGGKYVIGSPLFKEATIQVGEGKTFHILAHNNSKENVYIQSATLNGKSLDKPFIDFKSIVSGGELVFEMGNQPTDWGSSAE